jgi:hypothetical protein
MLCMVSTSVEAWFPHRNYATVLLKPSKFNIQLYRSQEKQIDDLHRFVKTEILQLKEGSTHEAIYHRFNREK